MRRLLLLVATIFIAACAPTANQIQTAIAQTQRAVPPSTPMVHGTATQAIDPYEQAQLATFCREFNSYSVTQDAFTDDFNRWLDEIGDRSDPTRAREFRERAGDLWMEVRDFSRPAIARQLHDLMLEYAASLVDEMNALVNYMENPDPQTYQQYFSIFRDNVMLQQHLLDAFNDLMNAYDIDPVTCEQYSQ